MWQALTERHSPVDDLSPVEMEADLLRMEWNEKDNPDRFLEQIVAIESRREVRSVPT